MDTYVCLVLNHQRQIVTVEALTAETEAQALHHAREFAGALPDAASFELWRKGKKITHTLAPAGGGGVR